MQLPRWIALLLCLGALTALSGCQDYNGFGYSDGFGGYTKGYGDVDESYKPVGLCSYLGGCAPEGTIQAPEIGPSKSDSSNP
jgi:hypothetical protein